MTKEETVKIMAMLGAFYSGGKNDPRLQANAWHLILQPYDFRIAEKAVLIFAKNDTRDYASFPAVGKIVAEIEKLINQEKSAVDRIIRSVSYGKEYEQLPDDSKALISKEMYDEWLEIDAGYFAYASEDYAKILRRNQQNLLASGTQE